MIRPLILLFLFAPLTVASEKPQLWGYGVQPCRAYVAAFEGAEIGQEEHIIDYMHFQDWLAGFVSGLSVATGRDVLRGVTVEGALRRLHIRCSDKPDEDFFTATRSLVRLLSALDKVE